MAVPRLTFAAFCPSWHPLLLFCWAVRFGAWGGGGRSHGVGLFAEADWPLAIVHSAGGGGE